MRRRPVSRSLAALAAAASLATALGGVVTPVAAAHADQDASWTVRTASNDLGAERTAYAYTLEPGATLDDALVVANHGTTSLDLGVYAADGYTNGDGSLDVVTAGTTSIGVGAWLTTANDHVTVAPGAQVTVPFTVSVPGNATPGDHAGGIVTSLTAPSDQPGVNVDRRLGIRVDVRVGGQLAPSLAIEDMKLGWDGGLDPFARGDATLRYSLHNTGNAQLTATQAVTVAGPFGWFPHDAAADPSPRLLPGDTWDVTVHVPDVAALLVLLGTTTVTPILVDASGSTTGLTPVIASVGAAAVPWTTLLVLLLVVGAVVVAVIVSRRRAATRRRLEDERVEEAVRQALDGREPADVSTTG